VSGVERGETVYNYCAQPLAAAAEPICSIGSYGAVSASISKAVRRHIYYRQPATLPG